MREEIYKILRAALEGAEPYRAVKSKVTIDGERLVVGKSHFHLKDFERITVIGAGKATLPMAVAIEEILAEKIDKGLIVTKYHEEEEREGTHLNRPCSLKISPDFLPMNQNLPGLLRKIRIIEASHPIPDHRGKAAALEIIAMLTELTEKDLVICLLSGGASALIPAPLEGLSLEEKQSVTQLLLKCGASINEINAIRKHLSRLKGGGMARMAYPATILTLILSDVIDDPLDVIASGPTVGDPTTFKDCWDIIQKYKLETKISPFLSSLFKESPKMGKTFQAMDRVRRPDSTQTDSTGSPDPEKNKLLSHQETPKPGDPIFSKVTNIIIGNNLQSLEKAALEAENLGFKPLILTSRMEGEAREVAKVLGAMVKEMKKTGYPLAPPVCLLAGGETTVTITGNGKGGRNQELALALAMKIAGLSNILIACMGTDGTDGPTEAAGALVDGDTAARASRLGINCWDYLSENNSYNFFKQLNDLIITGATGTNVMDIFVALIRK